MSNIGPDGRPCWWTTSEDRILRDGYPTVGPSGVATALPGRTLRAIYVRARMLGLSAPIGSRTGIPRRKYETSEEIDRIISTELAYCTDRGSLCALADRIGRPRWWLSRRGAELGLISPKFQAARWSAAELALLEQYAALTPAGIGRILRRAGFRRSISAIAVKLKRLGCDRTDPDVHNARDLAVLMGVSETTVRRWITMGGLRVDRRNETEAAGGTYRITRKHLRAWMRDRPTLVDLRKADSVWLIDLLAGAPWREA